MRDLDFVLSATGSHWRVAGRGLDLISVLEKSLWLNRKKGETESQRGYCHDLWRDAGGWERVRKRGIFCEQRRPVGVGEGRAGFR